MSCHDATIPLRHMLEDAQRALELASDDTTSGVRHAHLALQGLLTALGDKASGLKDEIRKRHAEVDWQALALDAEHVRRDYDSLDPSELRATARRSLPSLVVALAAALATELEGRSRTEPERPRSDGPAIVIPKPALLDLSRRYRIRRLALFGSVLREDFGPSSDVDVLVEFEPGHTPGLAFFRLQDELAHLLGRDVDLVTRNSLSPYLRDQVLAQATEVFVAA